MAGAATVLGFLFSGAVVGPAAATHDGSAAPACRPRPVASQSLNEQTVELRELRRELADQCAALAYWQSHAHQLLVTLRTAEDQAGGLLADVVENGNQAGQKLDLIYGRQADPVALTRGGSATDPLFTSAAAASDSASSAEHGQSDEDPTWVRLATPSVGVVQDAAKGVVLGLGLGLGLMLVTLAMPAIRRWWLP